MPISPVFGLTTTGDKTIWFYVRNEVCDRKNNSAIIIGNRPLGAKYFDNWWLCGKIPIFHPACHLHLMHTSALKRRLIPISDSRTLESYYGKFPIFFKTDVRHNHVSRPQKPLVQKISTFIVHSSSKYLHFFKNCYF